MTSAQVRAHRRDLEELTTIAKRDLARVAAKASGSAESVRDGLMDVVPNMVGIYGEAAASLGADFYDELRDVSGVKGNFRGVPADLPGRARADALVRWGVDPLFAAEPNLDATVSRISGGLQRIVANADRQTVLRSVSLDPHGKGWQRITAGGCSFCQMLAGRGAVYTEASADFLSHDRCHCTAVPVWSEQEAPLPSEALEPPKELEPEEQYVEKIVGMLQQPDRKAREAAAADLRRALDDPATKELSRINIQEAFRRSEIAASTAQKAAAPSVRAAKIAPEGSVARKVDFPQQALDALLPKGGWTTSTRTKTIEALKKSSEGRQLLKTMDSFQSGGSTAIPRLRTDIEKYLAGEVDDMPQGRQDAIENFLSALGRSDAGDRNLFRGMSIPGDMDEVAARYKAGDDLDLSLASFSTDKKLAQDFTLKGAGQKVRGKIKTPVLVEWVGGGKRALPIEKLSKSRVFANEKEWVGAGRYTIENARRVKRNGVETLVLTIRQKAIW